MSSFYQLHVRSRRAFNLAAIDFYKYAKIVKVCETGIIKERL